VTHLPHVAILLVAIVLVAADKDEKQKGSDIEAIQGKWIVIASVYKGKKSGDYVGNMYAFSGKTMTLTLKGSDRNVKVAFELRPEKEPRELTLKVDGGKVVWKVIYELSGDTLNICELRAGTRRPEAMGSTADDDRQLIVLKRVKGDDKK
jgi:uncharacterized protein (TIGR03067 family)